MTFHSKERKTLDVASLTLSINPEHQPTLLEVEDAYIELMLKYTNGNQTHAAELLNIDRRTLRRKICKKNSEIR
jgi:DNA-binding protein Fis